VGKRSVRLIILHGWYLLLPIFIAACQTSATQAPAPLPTPTAGAPAIELTAAPAQTELSPSSTPAIFLTPTPVEGIPQEADQLIPPIPPSQLTAVKQNGSVELKWQGTGSDILTHYTIRRRASEQDPWTIIANLPVQGDNRVEYVFSDLSVVEGADYEYSVTSVDHYGNESDLSEIARTAESAP
jgi:hypothetical protein